MNIIVGSGSSILGIAATVIALVSLCFAIYSWRQANRPLVSARLTTHSGGNVGIALNLLVENTGNRPAKDICFVVKEADVRAAHTRSSIPKEAERCFFSGVVIPVLANGRSASNAFGYLGQEQTDSWRAGSEIPITLKYKDLSGRTFSSRFRLILADDAGFAQTFWGDGHQQER